MTERICAICNRSAEQYLISAVRDDDGHWHGDESSVECTDCMPEARRKMYFETEDFVQRLQRGEVRLDDDNPRRMRSAKKLNLPEDDGYDGSFHDADPRS